MSFACLGQGRIKKLFVLWLKLVTHVINDKNFIFLDKISQAWDINALDSINLGKHPNVTFQNSLNNVNGNCSHVITYLLVALGWHCISFAHWIDKKGDDWVIDIYKYQPCCFMSLICGLAHFYHTSKLPFVQAHFGGSVVCHPFDWGYTLARNKALTRKNGIGT